MTLEEAKKKFHKEVVDKASEVDPDNERYWTDLAYGYLLALGFPPGEDTLLAAYDLEL